MAFFLIIMLEAFILALLIAQASLNISSMQGALKEKKTLVRSLKLTDLCLFTEARYTRHLSQADLNTPFQDHPLSLEHFPSGSFTLPTNLISKRK